MANGTETKLRVILENLYAASRHRKDCAVLAENALAYMKREKNALQCDIQIRAVKGGTYKIKEYYLENNELSDIRGASAIITEVQEKIIPDLLWQIFGFDCVIYNGGGNMLAIIPEDAPDTLAEDLEQAAERCLLTANAAYVCTEPFRLSELLGEQYKNCVASIEQLLTERKKSRAVCNIQPVSDMSGEILCDVVLPLPEPNPSGRYCSRCHKRLVSYQICGKLMCGGCAHKFLVGSEQKQRFVSDYRTILQKEGYDFADRVKPTARFEDIDSDHIAVVYADGNNMGGLIQNIRRITEMMDFSEFVKKTMPELVFRSMAACRVYRFELVAVGGDDIFILLPAKKAIAFSNELIRLYKEAYDTHFEGNQSTLSVGVCIAKPDESVKVMLETAENKLSDAKRLMKQRAHEKSSGSLSFAVLDSYEGVLAAYEKQRSMLPYSLEQLQPILEFVYQMQKMGMKTRIRNIAEAYANAESEAEMSLFFRYLNAKEKSEKKQIKMPKIDKHTLHDGYYETTDGKAASFWEDIIDLMNYYDSTSDRGEG